MPRRKPFIKVSDAVFMLAAAGVLAGIFVAGYFFLFSLLTGRGVDWVTFFVLFSALALLNIFLLVQFWKRRFRFGVGWQAFMLLWGPLAIWYWLFAPIYYFFTVNLDTARIALLGFIYLWEVPVVGGIFIALALARFWRIRRFQETGETKNPESLYKLTFQYPAFVGIALFLLSVIGYTIGTVQLNTFGELPKLEQAKSVANGVVVAIFLALFYSLVFDRFLEPIRLALEKRYDLGIKQEGRLTVRIFMVTLLVVLGSVGLFSLLIVESWQMIERENILREMRDDALQVTRNLVLQLEQNSTLSTEDVAQHLETLRQGERGEILILDPGEPLPGYFSPQTQQLIAQQPFGVVEDFRKSHKIMLFTDGVIPGKVVVSIAYMKDFYGIFQETFQFLAIGALFVTVLSVSVITFMSFAISERARRLARLVRRAEAGDTKSLRPIPSGDEFDALSRSFIRFATREKELQSHLEKEKIQYEGIVKDIGEGLVVTDGGGKVVTINPAAASLVGYEEKEVMGKKWASDIPRVLGEQGKSIALEQTATFRAIKQKKPSAATYYYVRKDGSSFPVHVTATPFIMKGKIIGSVSVFRDITKEKEIDRAKSEFVSIASHQLRTPLTAIRWSFEKLVRQEKSLSGEKNKEYTNQLFGAVKRMNKLIDALLNVSRIELGTLRLQPKPLDAISLAEQVLQECKSSVEEKELRVEIEWEDGLPHIAADPNFLVIVFQNLISNAIKYTPPRGSITLMAISQQGSVVFSVQDTGYGIPKGQHDKIFTKLFRADNAAAKDKTGTGLGLYITRFIVEQSKGKIWFTSEEGKGTTFFFTLPIQEKSNRKK
ncbi:MAG TPA: ATP-binding protein [Candidatus Paceibacterota bacterium]